MDLLVQSLVGLRWQDVFDILLNSYILFRLYILFRGTNVIRMLVAICMLWFLERMAMSIGLIVTSWAIQGIIAAAALIIIIVFRNEIAGVFQARSLKSFFWGIPQRQFQTPIEIITESVFEIAHQGLGALIVLPLKKGIEEVVHGGVSWHGILSKEMLLSIFWNGTPVHDGAAIIQGNQILEVATILPISKNSDLPSHFGTRHRAAVGLVEQTDALVIVVSEERGEVTVFQDRSIITIEDSSELEQVLREHTGTIPTAKGMRKITVEMSLAGLICFVGITGIWFSFARGVETLATMEVPIEFINRDSRLEVFSASESSVKLQVSGSGSLIRSIRPDQLKVKLNLANAEEGNNQVAITREGIILPPGINLKKLEPQVIEVNLDVPVMKKLAVQPDWTGKLPAEIIMLDEHTVPEVVEVVGGKHTLEDLRTIYTEKIPLENITGDGEVSADLVLSPSSLKLADQAQQMVTVIYHVTKRPAEASATHK